MISQVTELKREKVKVGMPATVNAEEKKLLKDGVPIQKITGRYINTYEVTFDTGYNVLIPRYETDELLSRVLLNIKPEHKVLDLCAGSGLIGLTVKKETDADVTCADISDDAILALEHNAVFNELDIEIVKSDLFENLENKVYDFIVCNPPYIPTAKIDKKLLDNEPNLALDGGKTGNDVIKKIIAEFDKHLKPSGEIWFEIMEDNAKFLKGKKFTILNDINQKVRFAYYKKPGNV